MNYELYPGDCLEVMPRLEAGSVNLIAVDLPYYKAIDAAWDNAWPTRDDFLAWVGRVCDEWQRLLAPNGSVYAFASPQMAWYVEGVIRQRFNVLNRITWIKEAGWHQKQNEDSLRAYFPQTEPIFFAENFNSDSLAGDASGYFSECFDLQKKVFAPLGDYFKTAKERSGMTRNDIEVMLGYTSSSDPTKGTALYTRWEFGQALPGEQAYHKLRNLLGYELLPLSRIQLGEWYEDLRRQYEDLRRPFNATPDAPYTDVWTFPTVAAYPGKHPTEKPVEIFKQIVSLSSRPGDVVLDCCMGHGTCGIAAGQLGRRFIGIELDSGYFAEASTRIAAAYGDWDKARKVKRGKAADTADLPLFN